MRSLRCAVVCCLSLLFAVTRLPAQGVTTGQISGIVTERGGGPVADAAVTAIHVPSGTQYRGITRATGAYTIPGMRVGGPYRVTATIIGYRPDTRSDIEVSLGQNLRVDFALERQALQVAGIEAVGAADPVLNPDRTGAATTVTPEEVALMPSIKRSTRDLTRLDPRSDGNFSFAGRNWLYNNISLDGSYFGNPFGLDDPAPGGQANAEPVPYDAVEQVQVSIAPFDVRQGGFTGANINTVTRSGTNQLRFSLYSFGRNESFQGNTVRGSAVSANPDLSFFQAGFSIGGPIRRDKLFFFLNFELERTDDPGTAFSAWDGAGGTPGFGVSRVRRDTMDLIRQRMMAVYGYDTGPYEGYILETDNNKLLARLDWNISENSNLSFRYNYLDASRDQGPHPFVLSYANAGRGPNSTTLPFRNSGYAINNSLHSFAAEWNSRTARRANRLFASYNRFRDHRDPFSTPFPTIDIGQNGVGYTTVGHEPFSIHNILDQDVLQLTDNLSFYRGNHTITLGTTFESFHFFNSFNIFRHGVFFLPYGLFPGTATFDSPRQFLDSLNSATPPPFASFVGSGLYKGEFVHVGQWALYAQDELIATPRLNISLGMRVDFPIYFTKPVDNPFSRGLTARDETGATEIVDQSKMPSATPLFSPRIGFNLNAAGDRRTQLRGGTGIFTGRVPFVWVGNVLSNPGANPNLAPGAGAPVRLTKDSSQLAQSFDVNAMDPGFKWPQAWTTDFAIDQRLPWDLVGTLEFIYSKDINAVFMRNADLPAPVGTVGGGDGRPYYGGCAVATCPSTAATPELNADGGAGIYVIDNINRGWSANATAQLRKTFRNGLTASLSYSFTDARNTLKSTEIASVLWQNQPVQGDPNNPGLSYSEFGQRNRIVGGLTYAHNWSASLKTSIGVFFEMGQGNRFAGAGGNRYSYIYSGDVNGDGYGGNDLIFIPATQADITLVTCATGCGANVTPAQQWAALDAFISQDTYLNAHRGQIAQRFGALNPWYSNVDLRILQDIGVSRGGANTHRLQISLDILNLGNLISSSWGVRKVASASATSPLTLAGWTAGGVPQFNFTGPATTFIDDPNLLSRWRMQLGLRYLFN